MASFKVTGIDDVMKNMEKMASGIDGFKCPVCGKPFRLSLKATKVTCPHCKSTIEIEHK